ncbi:hypothetical protein FSP39_006308 [Pinctada imbricata]|uniref:SH3 domain-containing protein n=1 Tax=Pinctada imbricata TaxID=66713 RepID=A0AA88XZH5_PINIB|nr:hypothetical protein FSP39_006308 [Pinctada imbricata]
MESCHSVKLCELKFKAPPSQRTCRQPAHSALTQLINIIEKLRFREYAVPDISSKLRDKNRSMQCTESVLGGNQGDMEVEYGTNQSQQYRTAIGTLELELIKLQQNNECLVQENTAQHKRMRMLEQKLKPLQDKNKSFLEKNIELTNSNRSLEGQVQRLTDEGNKLRDQCEQNKKKIKHLTQLLNQEKSERGDLEIKYCELEDIRRQYIEQRKQIDELKGNLMMKYPRETTSGFDVNADSSVTDNDSPMSTSLETQDLSADDSIQEVCENKYQQLMKEYLQLQRTHSQLQTHTANQELQLRSQLESDLFTSQYNIEKLQTLLSQSQETIDKLNKRIIVLKSEVESKEKKNDDLKTKLSEADERIETLEFQLVEIETTSADTSFNDKEDDEDDGKEDDDDDDEDDEDEFQLALEDIPMMTDSHTRGNVLSFHGNKVIPQHMQSLEDMVRDLQVKVVQLQEENCRLEERLAHAQKGTLSLEEREAREVMTAKEFHSEGSQTDDLVTQAVILLDKIIQTDKTKPDNVHNIDKDTLLLLQREITALREENSLLNERLLLQNEADAEDPNESFHSRISEMSDICENLQERLNCSETSERQMKEKLKLAEDTINDLESHEISARDMLDKAKSGEVETRRRLSEAEHKISELKELILDKDVYEMNLSEKVQFLEQAEIISAQKIGELEGKNELLQQRLDLKEDLEADILLLETLKDKIAILENENNVLNTKIAELEENEETLKNNWLKAAENDANRSQIYESKIKSLESLNNDLKSRIKDLQENSDVFSLSGPSLATELSESGSLAIPAESDSVSKLQNRLRQLEEELSETRDKRDADIEVLQDKIGKLKDNEVKLSESLLECELAERELKSRIAIYEGNSSSAEKMMQYEGKIKEMQNSREDLLDRLDSMEDHEVNLKTRMKETEEVYEQRLSVLEKELENCAERETALTSKVNYFEQREKELDDKVKQYDKEVTILKSENEEIKSLLDQNDSPDMDVHHELELSIGKKARLEKEVEELRQTILDQDSELEQLRSDNEDLNERLIELDSSEQECMEKMMRLEQECKRLKHFRDKCDILEDAENKLMERVSELEESENNLSEKVRELEETEDKLRSALEKRTPEMTSEVKPEVVITTESKEARVKEDKETDTTDLVESPEHGRNSIVGMFQHLQDVESQNQKLNDELLSLRGADNLNRNLTEKVRLLESSEDSLMERVMELEESEDKLKQEVARLKASASVEVADIIAETADLRKSVELLKVNVEMLESENEDYTDKIQEYLIKLESAEQTIAQLEKENSEYKEKISNSEEQICFLETNLAKSEKTLKNEQEKIESFLKSEEKLFKSIASEKTRADELNRKYSDVNEKLTKYEKENASLKEEKEELLMQSRGKRKLSQSLEMERSRVEDLVCALSALQKVHSENISDHEKKVSQLEDMLADIEEKEIKNLKRIDELSNQNQQLLAENERVSELSDENMVLLKIIENNKSKQDDDVEMEQDGGDVGQISGETQNTFVRPVEICDACRVAREQQQMASIEDADDSETGCLACTVAETRQSYEDCKRCKEEQDVTITSLQSNLEDIHREKEDLLKRCSELSGDLSQLESSNSNFSSENKLLSEKLKNIESELHSKEAEFLSKEKHLQAQVDSLRTSEKYLQQKLDSVESAYGSGDNSQCNDPDVKSYDWSPEEVNASQDELLSRIQILERSNRSLECRLEYFEAADKQTDIMLDKPEDILRQRIIELEKLEKHLKIQVSELEKDREELYEITRKDKNTIHEQNIKIHELQLAEKTVKIQIEKCEATERELYSKIEDLEDQIRKMEDRISELTILEMRLKKLVQKYKLDEEVWLSKSQDLSVSLSELSVSEAQLKQHVGNLEKEKMTLAEKSEYLELRLKEVENAETSLIQRAKDQENLEISMNNKLSELQRAQSNAEMQVIELHTINLDLSQRLNQSMADNAVLNQMASQLQNQVSQLQEQLQNLQESETKFKGERAQASRSHKNRVKDTENGETEERIQQLEEAESQLKVKLNQAQRNENRLLIKIRELESQTTLDLSKSQKERLPRKLEDCQRRIMVLQNHNEELRELVNGSQGATELQGAKMALLEQVGLMEQTVYHLQNVVNQASLKKGADSHRKDYEALQNGLLQIAESIKILQQLLGQYQEEEIDNLDQITPDRTHLSYARFNGERCGPHADRRTRGQKVVMSKVHGRPVQKLANQMVNMEYKGRELLDDQSDASTVEEEPMVKQVQGKTNMPHTRKVAKSSKGHPRQDGPISSEGKAEMYMPPEEAHWMEVESRLLPLDNGRWIQVGKATGVQSKAPERSHNTHDQELVLGLTLASESEESFDAQNDTDSSMWSPVQKRRKFRSVHGTTDKHERILPQKSSSSTLANHLHSYATDSMSEGGDATPTYLSDDNREGVVPQGMVGYMDGSLPDSGLGTTSLTSTGKQSYLREKLAAIGRTLEKQSLMQEANDETESEENITMQQLTNANREIKNLKEKINTMERDLERKTQYITMLENFMDKVHQLLSQKNEKPEAEVIQAIEAELQKTMEEVRGLDLRKSEHSEDLPSLNALLDKRERELKAKTSEVDSLLQELKQWQDECRTIEDMRTNALDAVRVLEMEVANLHRAEKELKHSKEAYSTLNQETESIERTKEDALMALAPLKARINHLSQKCREKDSLLRRLGEELRRTKEGGQDQRTVLEELSTMEQRMEQEEYNTQYSTLPSMSRGSRRQKYRGVTASMTDLDDTSSTSSVIDGQENVAYSDTETLHRGHMGKMRNRRHDAPWNIRTTKGYSRSLPHIHHLHKRRGDSFSAKPLPVGHMPPDPMFVAVVDYDPDLYSRSGRREAELTLKEWDQVKVIGPLDETGYYEAVSNGLRGLVPAAYLRPASLSDVDHRSWTANRPTVHPHLNSSPERIIQVHTQLQQSHSPQNHGTSNDMTSLTNGHQSSSPQSSPIPPTSQTSNVSTRIPDPPRNFRIEKVINQHTIMLAWTPPHLKENSYSNGVKVLGYKIYINGKLHQHAQSPHIAKTIVKNIDTSHSLILAIQTTGTTGQVSDLVETKLDRQELRRDVNVQDSDVYRTGKKRSFVGIYDFVPSPGKNVDSELIFQAGDHITVYGEERMDGYYYGEVWWVDRHCKTSAWTDTVRLLPGQTLSDFCLGRRQTLSNFCLDRQYGISDTDIESDAWQAHTAAAKGEIHHIVQAVQQDPSVLEQEDGNGKMMATVSHKVQPIQQDPSVLDRRMGMVSRIIQAVRQDPSVLEQKDGKGLTPLMHAVKNRQMGAMKKLIKLGANINAQDSHGRTSLATAVYQGWYEGVVYLLRKSAKQSIAEKSGRLPIHASTYDKDIRIIGALLQTLSKEEVCQTDNEKMTALHWAAFHNRPEHFQLLMMSGVDLNAQDIDGKTPLHWAAQNGSVECCTIIIQCCKGPELINRLDYSGKSAVHYSSAAGHSLLLRQLADVDGCHLELEDPDDRTPLHWAAAMGQTECVKILLDHGVSASPMDLEGGSPLEYAQQSGHSGCTKLLEDKLGIKHSPSVKTKHKKGKKSAASDSGRKSAASTTSSHKSGSSDTGTGTNRSPFGRLKDLFKSKGKRNNSTTPTTSEKTSDSIEMKVISDNSPGRKSSKTKENKSGANKNKVSMPKDIPQVLHNIVVPKIIFSSVDSDEEGVLLKHRRKHKKSKKHVAEVLSEEVHQEPEIILGRHKKQTGVLSSSPNNFLPPVMSPRISPIPPKLTTAQDLPKEPPPRKSTKELAPLRVPVGAGKSSPLPEKVARLKREKNGHGRSPTPPPLSSYSENQRKLQGLSPLAETPYFHALSAKQPAPKFTTQPSLEVTTDDEYDDVLFGPPKSGRITSRRQSRDTSPWSHVNSYEQNELLSMSPPKSGQSLPSRRQSQDTSPWLQVNGDGQGDILSLSSRSSRSRTISSRRQSQDHLSVSSGQRSGLSSAHSGHSSENNFKLSPIPPSYGRKSPLLTTGSPPQLSTLEKRTLDRTIQSLLH